MSTEDTTSTAGQIRDILVRELQWSSPPEELTDDLPLIENHIVDSLSLLRLVTRIEADFGIQIRDEDVVIANFGSIGRIADFVDSARGADRGT